MINILIISPKFKKSKVKIWERRRKSYYVIAELNADWFTALFTKQSHVLSELFSFSNFNFNVDFFIEDRVKLYNHPYMDPDGSPESLQRKVQFDIRLYFFRRGAENMESMKKDHFKMVFDRRTEEWKVMKNKDELTKNHREAENIIGGVLPENKDDRLCPVCSYNMYVEHLNPENEYLWQVPLRKIDPTNPNVWYGKNHIGKNPLAKFMSDVSKKCDLSMIYTNHCIRVTGATVLTRMKFSASEIMSVTGHKSVQSLAIYQKTKEKEKTQMGKVLFQSMTKPEDQINITQQRAIAPSQPQQAIMPPPPPPAVAEKPNAQAAIVPFQPQLDDQEVPEFDICEILEDIEKQNQQGPSATSKALVTSNKSNTNVMNNTPKTCFANCTIGNITFNIQK